MPIRKVATLRPLWMFLHLLVMTPASTSSTTPSENISEWMPRSFFSLRKSSTASGIAPMPSWRQSPSRTREATFSPIARSTSVIFGGASSMTGVSASMMQSMSFT